MAAASGFSIAPNNTLNEALLFTESRCEGSLSSFTNFTEPAVVRSQ